jgi:alginate O-acetyltransferase complex protein AlgI
MLFNSLEFALFLPLVFLLYWFVFQRTVRLQNFLLLSASCLFYGWWDWRFLFLFFFTAILDYVVSLGIYKSTTLSSKKILLAVSIVANLSMLAFFKYFNFFVDSWIESFALLGIQMNQTSMSIILPVGLSFYTFQSMGYTIDVFRGKLDPPKDMISYLAFVSFFPQLVAGPIERSTNMLPQFYSVRHFTYEKGREGIRQILWGLFKKVVIADTCADMVNTIFSNDEHSSTITLLLGAFYFAFQIYGDFSGYSDIALGTARLFGFELMVNFRYPYFSKNVAEFWRRWHISLSTWFRDYLYIPLGGSRGNVWMKIRNNMIVFIVSGFWHGANWTYVAWGLLNGIYLIPLIVKEEKKTKKSIAEENIHWLPSFKDLWMMSSTFGLICITWVFFRAKTISQAIDYFSYMFINYNIPTPFGYFKYALLIVALVVIEWFNRSKAYPMQNWKFPTAVRWSIYLLLITLIFYKQINNEVKEFIYFQF